MYVNNLLLSPTGTQFSMYKIYWAIIMCLPNVQIVIIFTGTFATKIYLAGTKSTCGGLGGVVVQLIALSTPTRVEVELG
jgi:hypothetical protein